MEISKQFQRFMYATEGFQRLAAITVGFLFVVGVGLYALRLVGLSHPPLRSPLADFTDGPLIFARGNEDVAALYTKAGFLSLASFGDRVVPALDIRSTVDRNWVIMGPGDIDQLTNGSGHFEGMTAEQIAALRWKTDESSGPLLLTDFLAQVPLKRMLLILHSRDQGAVRKLSELLASSKAEIFAFSPNHIINREMRKLQPTWNFGSDAAQLAQWHIFAAVGLEPMASQDFDWLLDSDLERIAPRVRQEILRREIPTLWNALSAPPKDTRLLGILTSRPTQALDLLKHSH